MNQTNGISDEMIEHLSGSVTLAVFLKITAADGDVLAVWNGTRNKILDGITYYAYPITPSRMQATKDLKPDNLEVTAVYSDLFSSKTLRSKKWSGARVEYRVMNYKDLSMGPAERRVGFIGQVKIGKYSATPELLSLSSKLAQPVGRTFQSDCDVVELGDARCAVDLSGLTQDGYKIQVTATVEASVNRQQFYVTFNENIKPASPSITIPPDDLYERGRCEFLTGENAGATEQILTNIGGGITLFNAAFYKIQAGDRLRLTTGCSRKIDVCRDRYGNGENYRGFFCLPGRGKLLKIPE